MTKRTGLKTSLLSSVGARKAEAEPAPRSVTATTGPKWREPSGTKRFSFRVSEDTHRQLKLLSVQLGEPMEALVIDQINRLFAEHDLPQIAGKP